ncbi:thioredoxin family protein [Bacteroides sp. An322]|jgi:hypothetical protein|uniref:TlpA family protein disulfide reductase n=1 Tax=Bacteroides sp. An322 TaxID=1965632 RepID=UPI000B390D18|nr:thioredoxin family protein [Bacteroides sp. An322]OUO23814.1 hypothetical protein B5F91_02970 [Bacteroides sp. An322]HJC99060.1 thioredoxin family protein [Candidatus Phocaeicola merdavium]
MIKNVKWFFVVLVFSSVISLAFSKENVHAEKLQEGDKIPALVLCDTVQPLDLHSAREGYTLLSFWASYDAVSRQNNAALAHLAGETSQVKMISVSFDRYASVFDATVEQDGLTNTRCYVETNGSDSEAFRAFDLRNGFSNYLVDAKGMIVAKNVTPAELASYLKK